MLTERQKQTLRQNHGITIDGNTEVNEHAGKYMISKCAGENWAGVLFDTKDGYWATWYKLPGQEIQMTQKGSGKKLKEAWQQACRMIRVNP